MIEFRTSLRTKLDNDSPSLIFFLRVPIIRITRRYKRVNFIGSQLVINNSEYPSRYKLIKLKY